MKNPQVQPNHYEIEQFEKWDKDGDLVLSAEFQRKPVWKDSAKYYLIDSILTGFPMPEIYIQKKRNQGKKRSQHIVIDGQQRLTTILEYLKNDFKVMHSESPENIFGKSFKDLSEKLQETFWSYSIITREIVTDDDKLAREIFRRINTNVYALNPQELRNATYQGDLMKVAKTLTEKLGKFLLNNNLTNHNEVSRMNDTDYIINEMLLYAINDKNVTSNKATKNKMYRDYDKDFKQKSMIKNKIIRTKEMINDLFTVDGLEGTIFTTKSNFLALFTSLYYLNQHYSIQKKKYPTIKKELKKFSKEVQKMVHLDERKNPNESVEKYAISVLNRHTTSSKERDEKNSALEQLLLPYCVSLDKKRAPNEAERLYIWNTKTHKCAKCRKTVKQYSDYDCDHKTKWTDGGKTELSNLRVLHKKCNRSDNQKL